MNFIPQSLYSLARTTPTETIKITATISNGSKVLYKKGIYPYEYLNSWERFSKSRLLNKEIFYSKLNNKHVTDEEHVHTQRF